MVTTPKRKTRRYTKAQLAAKLGVHPYTLSRWSRVGLLGIRLVRHKPAGRVYYLGRDVRRFFRAIREERERRARVSTRSRGRASKRQDEEDTLALRAMGLKI